MSGWLKCLAILLFPLPLFYTLAVYLRNKFYDWGWFTSEKLPAIVISVGNIQLGGTGKTPLVQLLAEFLQKEGYQPVILTRGYKRRSRESIIIDHFNRDKITPGLVGDEPFLLSRNLPGIMIAVDTHRRRIALEVLKKNPQAIFLLDDGFQHRQLQRDLDLVLVDCSRWSGLPILFPLSQFRDVRGSLRRADVLVFTQREENFPEGEKLLPGLSLPNRIPVFSGKYQAVALQRISDGKTHRLEEFRNKNIAAFCGIAHPAGFFEMLQGLGMRICWKTAYRDHYDYQESDIQHILRQAGRTGAEYVVTTQKDAVKVSTWSGIPAEHWYFLQVEFRVEPAPEFTAFLRKRVSTVDPGSKINKKRF